MDKYENWKREDALNNRLKSRVNSGIIPLHAISYLFPFRKRERNLLYISYVIFGKIKFVTNFGFGNYLGSFNPEGRKKGEETKGWKNIIFTPVFVA